MQGERHIISGEIAIATPKSPGAPRSREPVVTHRIRTRLSFRSTLSMASLLESDILGSRAISVRRMFVRMEVVTQDMVEGRRNARHGQIGLGVDTLCSLNVSFSFPSARGASTLGHTRRPPVGVLRAPT